MDQSDAEDEGAPLVRQDPFTCLVQDKQRP